MHVNLIVKDGVSIGYTMEAENEAERKTLGSIRNRCFFDLDGGWKYDGVVESKEFENQAQMLKFKSTDP